MIMITMLIKLVPGRRRMKITLLSTLKASPRFIKVNMVINMKIIIMVVFLLFCWYWTWGYIWTQEINLSEQAFEAIASSSGEYKCMMIIKMNIMIIKMNIMIIMIIQTLSRFWVGLLKVQSPACKCSGPTFVFFKCDDDDWWGWWWWFKHDDDDDSNMMMVMIQTWWWWWLSNHDDDDGADG